MASLWGIILTPEKQRLLLQPNPFVPASPLPLVQPSVLSVGRTTGCGQDTGAELWNRKALGEAQAWSLDYLVIALFSLLL